MKITPLCAALALACSPATAATLMQASFHGDFNDDPRHSTWAATLVYEIGEVTASQAAWPIVQAVDPVLRSFSGFVTGLAPLEFSFTDFSGFTVTRWGSAYEFWAAGSFGEMSLSVCACSSFAPDKPEYHTVQSLTGPYAGGSGQYGSLGLPEAGRPHVHGTEYVPALVVAPLDNARTAVVGHAPEPASWALMLVGFFALGWRLRRRVVVRPGPGGVGGGKRQLQAVV